MTQLASQRVGSGPYLIFLHGMAGSGAQWAPVTGLLRDRFTCVTVDLPGMGASPRTGAYDVASVARAVHETVSAVTDEPVVYIGHSAGTYPALICSLLSQKVYGTVLEETALDLVTFGEKIRSIREQLLSSFESGFAAFARSIGVGQEKPTAAEVIAATLKPDQDVVLRYWADMISDTPLETLQQQLIGVLRAVRVPVLAIYSAGMSEGERRVLATIQNVEIEHWPGLGHFAHLSEPARFATRVEEFARSLNGGR